MLTATTDTVPSHRADSGGRGVKVKAGPGRGGFWKKMAWSLAGKVRRKSSFPGAHSLPSEGSARKTARG